MQRTIDLAPLRRSLRNKRIYRIPSTNVVFNSWKRLASMHRNYVSIERLGSTPLGNPIAMVTVSKNAQTRELPGGHLSLNGVHAPEQLQTLTSYITGSFVLGQLDRNPHLVYRCIVSGDWDGAMRNTYLNRELSLLSFVTGKFRHFGSDSCIDFEMPAKPWSTDSVARNEARLIAEQIRDACPDSILSSHQMAWNFGGYGQSNECLNRLVPLDIGMLRSLSLLLQYYVAPVRFMGDDPAVEAIAPGIFPPHRMESGGPVAMADFVEAVAPNGGVRWSLHDLPMFRPKRLPNEITTCEAALEASNLRHSNLIDPFVERMLSLPLDDDNASHISVKKWLNSHKSSQPKLSDFIPMQCGRSELAQPDELFRLGDYRMFYTLLRFAETVVVAKSLGQSDLAMELRSKLIEELDCLGITSGFQQVPLNVQLEAGAMWELMLIDGSLQNTGFDFGDELHNLYASRQTPSRHQFELAH